MNFFCLKLTEFLNQNRHKSLLLEILYLYNHYPSNYGKYINEGILYDVSFKDMENVSFYTIKNGIPNDKTRVYTRFGRFLNKIINKEYNKGLSINSKSYEDAVNIYKNYFDCDPSRIKVVHGKDIQKFYLEETYHNDGLGSLCKSCMRYDYKNPFMEIYSKNDKVKMLTFFSSCGKLKGRALLWEEVQDLAGNKWKVMDRIYTTNEYNVNLFKEWAIENGYIHKSEQSNRCERGFISKDGHITLDLKVTLDNVDFEFYPYMDTFKFFSKRNKTFGNSECFDYESILVQNYGGLNERDDIHNKRMLLGHSDEEEGESNIFYNLDYLDVEGDEELEF